MAATLSSTPVDLKTQGTYTVRLGDSILKPTDATLFSGIRYNYRPPLEQGSDVKASITRGQDVGESNLSLETDDGEYTYAGQFAPEQQTFVLVVRARDEEREMVLERVQDCHSLNLTGTPSDGDGRSLARKHPHLPAADPQDDGLFGDEDEEEPIDQSNPFDFRRFLQAELDKPENTQPMHGTGHSTAGTPLVRSTKPVATKAPLAKKRKAQLTEKSTAKRVKAGQDPTITAPPSKAKSNAAPPKIRVDRKASLRKASVDDSGELILEDETPVTSKAPKNALALALAGQLGGGPISLRSAASSPGRVASPPQDKEDGEVQAYEFEFGNSSSPEADDQPSQRTYDGEDGDLDAEDDADADVDDLELPSPAQKHRPSLGAALLVPGEDDEDDMEKQLALAMAAEDNESEESEEE